MNRWIANSLACFFVLLAMCGCARKTNQPAGGQGYETYTPKENTATQKTLTVATCTDYPPFEFKKDNKVLGADIKLAQYIAEKLNRKLVLQDMTFDQALVAVADKKVDIAIAAIEQNEERAKDMAFSDAYYTLGKQAVLVRVENKDQITDPAKLEGALVACANGGESQALLNRNIPKAEVLRAQNDDEAIAMLSEKQADAAAMGWIAAQTYCYLHPDTLCIAGIDIGTGRQVGLKIAVKKGDNVLLKAINPVIQQVEKLGLYDEWLQDAMQQFAGYDAQGVNNQTEIAKICGINIQ